MKEGVTLKKGFFLAKAINTSDSALYCADRQKGYISTEMHWHDCSEIIYMAKGNANVFFVNKRLLLKEEQMLFVPPGRVHCCSCTHEENERIVLGIKNSLICTPSGTKEDFTLPFNENFIDDFCLIPVDNENKERLLEIVRLDTEKPVACPLLVQAEILKLYAYVYTLWQKNGVAGETTNNCGIVYDIKKHLESTFPDTPSAEEMAQILHISYSYMHKLLKKSTNMSYDEILFSVRVEAAKKLLLTTNRSITEIGQSCGFCSSSYFSKIFKRHTGITPGKFRNFISERQ